MSAGDEFLWGAATSAHQVEGGNTASDWWAREHGGDPRIAEPSGAAADSYHRWPQDMDLLASAGFTDYRFSVEWARIEPSPGQWSQEALEHYEAMVRGALERGLRPLITLHHFTLPQWLAQRGGWLAPDAPRLFERYVERVSSVIAAGVTHVCTINEPNVVCTGGGTGAPDAAVSAALIDAHRLARAAVKGRHPQVQVGWSVASRCFQPLPGAESAVAAYAHPRETMFLRAAAGDDWLGVQSYTRTLVGTRDGVPIEQPVPDGAETTLTGWEYYPQGLGIAVRQAAAVVAPTPIIVTENGIATADDSRRMAYTRAALDALFDAMAAGIDVRGYFHWSLLDNYEWGSYAPTFGLVAVDRTTFERFPKPSLAWLGAQAP